MSAGEKIDFLSGLAFDENGKANLAESDINMFVALGMAIMATQIGEEAKRMAPLLEHPNAKTDITPRKVVEYFGDSVLHAAEKTFGEETCKLALSIRAESGSASYLDKILASLPAASTKVN